MPTYQLSIGYLLRGLGAALLAGAILGSVWGVLVPFGTFFFFGVLLGLGLGYVTGEAVSVAANRKAGSPLQGLAAGGVVVAYLVRVAILASALRHVSIVDIATNDLSGYIVLIVGAVIAMGRLR